MTARTVSTSTGCEFERPATVVELGSGTRARDGGDEATQQAIREALMDHAVARRLEDVHVLKDRLGMDSAVATGVRRHR